jgi:exodeoxyribonuclease VII small subunit
MATRKPVVDYQILQAELERILEDMQRDDLDIDLALKHYERGLEIVQQLERYLKQAENRIVELKGNPEINT